MTETTTFTLTLGGAITQAYRKLGILPSGGVPDADQYNQGMICANLLLKGWQADGINLWRQTQVSWAIPAGEGLYNNPYVVSPLILGLEEARLVISTSPTLYERPLAIYSYVDYMNLPNKNTGGSQPSLIMFDRQASASNIYIYPGNSSGVTINATVARTIYDATSLTGTLDFPIEWTETFVYCLADRLMDDEGVAAADPVTAQRIEAHAVKLYAKLIDFDRPAAIYVRPWGKKGSNKFWRS